MFALQAAAAQKSALGFSASPSLRGLLLLRSNIGSGSPCISVSGKPIAACSQTTVNNSASFTPSHLQQRVVDSHAAQRRSGALLPAKNIVLTAKVTVRRKRNASLPEQASEQLDAILDSVNGQKVLLQLVSEDVDPKTGKGKRSEVSALQDWGSKASIKADKIVYTAQFTVTTAFGRPGAVAITNCHGNEIFIESISLEGWHNENWTKTKRASSIYFSCYSWVQSKKHEPSERLVFANNTYLPGDTPEGLRDLRDKDLASLRGSGKPRGVRKQWERVYDYATYNDAGNPDKDSNKLARPTIGGSKELPYPRRCRTGRAPTKQDPNAESVVPMGSSYYVPRDEIFEEIKYNSFVQDSVQGAVFQLVPSLLNNTISNANTDFNCIKDIDTLYSEYSHSSPSRLFSTANGLTSPNEFIKQMQEESAKAINNTLKYPKPDIVSKDTFAWLRDDEFGREVLAGVNPVKVERLMAYPPVSNLDPEIYGSPQSALKPEHLEEQLGDLSIEEALEQGKLFMLDYHDIFLPFVNKINALEDRKMYATRTVFFLTSTGTLTPVAIELSLPPQSEGTSGTKRVITPAADSHGFWLWQLAKAHVTSNDAGFHQLHNHWLRGHAAAEPYIISTHRNLSHMHPIFKLLLPHFRYTLEINAYARQLLINADGVIENCFTPGPYSLEISSAAYGALWRFDQEGLPADLLARGMAIENENEPEGIELTIEDYPYANDGLLIWSAIKSWVNEYVSLYYGSNPASVMEDKEIQKWWEEIREVGHGDKASEPWWPKLETKEDLEKVLTTMIWVVTGYHAAVNFGQYAYGGYVPNRPCMTRRLIPNPGLGGDNHDYEEFMRNPEKFFLSTIPNQQQATTTMSVVNTLSTHSPDEEYLGERRQTRWTADPAALQASARFAESIQAVERAIENRNRDPSFANRNGAGVLPYELLIPSSAPGRTGRGVPNSVSI